MVKGNTKEYSFEVCADSCHLQEWQEDGIKIYEVVNTIPEWVADIGLTKPWCFLQDVFSKKERE